MGNQPAISTTTKSLYPWEIRGRPDTTEQASLLDDSSGLIRLPAPDADATVRQTPASELHKRKCRNEAAQFLLQLSCLALSSSALSLAITATVMTGGAGIPLVAMASVASAIAAGDVGCAWYNWQQVQNHLEPLQGGNDCVFHAVHELMCCLGAGSEKACSIGHFVSCIIRGGSELGNLLIAPAMVPIKLLEVRDKIILTTTLWSSVVNIMLVRRSGQTQATLSNTIPIETSKSEELRQTKEELMQIKEALGNTTQALAQEQAKRAEIENGVWYLRLFALHKLNENLNSDFSFLLAKWYMSTQRMIMDSGKSSLATTACPYAALSRVFPEMNHSATVGGR